MIEENPKATDIRIDQFSDPVSRMIQNATNVFQRWQILSSNRKTLCRNVWFRSFDGEYNFLGWWLQLLTYCNHLRHHGHQTLFGGNWSGDGNKWRHQFSCVCDLFDPTKEPRMPLPNSMVSFRSRMCNAILEREECADRTHRPSVVFLAKSCSEVRRRRMNHVWRLCHSSQRLYSAGAHFSQLCSFIMRIITKPSH